MYIGTLPVVIIYLAAYFILIKVPPNLTDSKDAQNSDETKPLQSNDIDNYLSFLFLLSTVQAIKSVDSPSDPVVTESSVKRMWRCLKLSSWLIINVCIALILFY